MSNELIFRIDEDGNVRDTFDTATSLLCHDHVKTKASTTTKSHPCDDCFHSNVCGDIYSTEKCEFYTHKDDIIIKNKGENYGKSEEM